MIALGLYVVGISCTFLVWSLANLYQPASSPFPQEAVEELLCGNVRKLSLLFLKEGCSFEILCFCIPKIHGSLLENFLCVGIRTLSLLFLKECCSF